MKKLINNLFLIVVFLILVFALTLSTIGVETSKFNKLISDKIGPIAKLDKIQFTEALPKTRSGKIMRRILRKIAANDFKNLGDISTLLNPEAVQAIIENNIK